MKLSKMLSKNVYDAVYPILLTTAVFGLSPIYVKTQNETRRLKISNLLKILNVFCLVLFSCLLYLAISDLQNTKLQQNYASGVSKIGIIFQLMAQVALAYVIYLVNISRCDEILSSIDDIKKIDEIFEDLGENIQYRKHFIYEISIISIGFVAIFGRAVINYLYMGKGVLSENNGTHFVFFFPGFVSFLLQNQFVLLIKLVFERFTLVNKLLDNLTREKISQDAWKVRPSQEYSLKHVLKRIELLMELHDYLTDVGNKINNSFTIQILSCFTAQFLTEVFTVFYLYYESLVLKNRIATLGCLLWTLSTTLEIFYVTITCHLTSRESKNTGVTVHKVLMNESDTIIKRKLMIFSQQVCHRPLQFSACGFFTIDATLIFTISGAAATYLLIMLQFQEGIEAQCSNNSTN